MKKATFYAVFFILLLLNYGQVKAQSAKKLYKSGKEMSNSGNFFEAVDFFTRSVEKDPKYIASYIERALCYEELDQQADAIADYLTLAGLQAGEYNWYYRAAVLYYESKKYSEALEVLNKSGNLGLKRAEHSELKMKCNYALSNYKQALDDCLKAIALNSSAENYYYSGLLNKILENYAQAEISFSHSVKTDPSYLNSYIGLSIVQLKQDKNSDALESVNQALKLNAKNKEANLLRSQIYRYNKEFGKALEDLNKLVSVYPGDYEILVQRGLTYFENNQFQNAVNDFSKVIAADSKHKQALYKRGIAYENLNKDNDAIKDFEKLLMLKTTSDASDPMYAYASKKILELSQENDPPVVTLVQDQPGDMNTLIVPENENRYSFMVKVNDRSKIIRLSVDKVNISFNPDSLKTGIRVTADILNKNNLTIECEDAFHNKSVTVFKISRTEINVPSFSISSPLTNEKNEIYFDPKLIDFIIEGRIKDKSKIADIDVNGYKGDFNPDELNPKFKVRPLITGQDKIDILISDIHGNTVKKTYRLNSNLADFQGVNPMGITWVVFIENSDYKSFTSFKGPEKDVSLMKNALSKYMVNNIIHKRNQTRQQMERFFNTELKDLIKENNVNSVMIWYAGLGKNIDKKSYWIPSDAKRDDESTYYNTNTLKSSLQAYSSTITHTLIVTDACETGPSFYMAMRGMPTDRDCNNSKATKFKSSQVFMSDGYMQEDENSDFSRSFANSLSFNSNACISIDKIASKVSSDVQKNNKRIPKFGKIAGFEDENGTFIFIKKQ
ncbi:MAG: tetratricopeptide repeat protein [Bacteroidales bacterium]